MGFIKNTNESVGVFLKLAPTVHVHQTLNSEPRWKVVFIFYFIFKNPDNITLLAFTQYNLKCIFYILH